jgi:hypothetical protein
MSHPNSQQSNIPPGFEPVVFAVDCRDCDFCNEPVCVVCGEHYADCGCIGPTEDDVEYLTIDGVLYGKRL